MKNIVFVLMVLLIYASCEEEISENEILSFTFKMANNSGMDEDQPATISGSAISVSLPSSIDIKNLTPTFTLSSKAVLKNGSVEQQNGVTSNDFTNAVTYTVVAEDGSPHEYIASVSVFLSPIVIPTFELSYNASAYMNSKLLESGVTAIDISSTTTFTIEAEDGSTNDYTHLSCHST